MSTFVQRDFYISAQGSQLWPDRACLSNLARHDLESTDIFTTAAHSGGKFEEQIGSKGSADPEQLHYALWTASQLLSGASSKASKRILIFTKDENPAGEAGTFK